MLTKGKSNEYSYLVGMSRSEVIRELGEPQRVISGEAGRQTLVYAHPNTVRREKHIDFVYIHLDERGLVTGID